MHLNYLIIGQGLAGSLLAWECARRGKTFRVIDPETGHSASHTAAGLYNPISGKRLVHDPIENLMVQEAHRCYEGLTTQWNAPPWIERNILRLFTSEQEIEQYHKRKKDPIYAPYIGKRIEPGQLANGVHASLGGFTVRQGGQVDLSGIIHAVRKTLQKNDLLIEKLFLHDELSISDTGAQWQNIEADTVLFAEGYRTTLNPYFDSIPWRHAKGEILDLFIPDLHINDVIHHSAYLIAMGNSQYILGATYEWDDIDEKPTAKGQADLLNKLKRFCDLPVEIIGHRAAVRPVAYDRVPVIGRHPDTPALALLNGLGAKGAIRGPYMAKTLMDHLENGTPFDPRYSVQHHWRPERAT